VDTEKLLEAIRDSLVGITASRFYETERGFQGELIAELRKRLTDSVLPGGAILEQEYQKRLKTHGIDIRPDIIIHEPFDQALHTSRRSGNHAVFELKRRASDADASHAFNSLVRMLQVLDYPIGIFVNIDSDATFSASVPEDFHDRIVCFAIRLGADRRPELRQD
jgi:hypothetical protein